MPISHLVSLFLVGFYFIIPACAPPEVKDGAVSGAVSKGQASYYSDKYQGKKTASGERYDKNKLTAAHKSLPFQTQVEVKNLKNRKSVVVVINDRLPAKSARIIDLSKAAAKELEMLRDGVVIVELKALK